MSWTKIEDHLFDKYCVEGEDKEFENLMREHDKEIIDLYKENLIKAFQTSRLEDYFYIPIEATDIVEKVAEEIVSLTKTDISLEKEEEPCR